MALLGRSNRPGALGHVRRDRMQMALMQSYIQERDFKVETIQFGLMHGIPFAALQEMSIMYTSTGMRAQLLQMINDTQQRPQNQIPQGEDGRAEESGDAAGETDQDRGDPASEGGPAQMQEGPGNTADTDNMPVPGPGMPDLPNAAAVPHWRFIGNNIGLGSMASLPFLEAAYGLRQLGLLANTTGTRNGLPGTGNLPLVAALGDLAGGRRAGGTALAPGLAARRLGRARASGISGFHGTAFFPAGVGFGAGYGAQVNGGLIGDELPYRLA